MENELLNKSDALILIVDDSPTNLQLLGKVLKENGYKLAIAQNGKQAVDFVSKKVPELVLMDVMMPEMNGFDACKLIHSKPETEDLPIIFLTGLSDDFNKTQAFEAGGVDYVTKPFVKEELLARVNANVRRRLAEERLRKINIDLQDALAAKNKFFSIMAHDIRNPLWAMMGSAEILANEINDLDKEDIASLGGVVGTSSQRLMSLLENLLFWSQSQTGRIEFNPWPTKLESIIDHVIETQFDAAKVKEITLMKHIDSNLEANVDSNMLTTVVRNLVSNAIKFTHQGGEIKISGSLVGEQYELSVADNGIGMNEDTKNRIFKLESNYSTKGTNKEEGTGLGLLLCKEFVEKHSGYIEVESEIGKGSSFNIYLPK